MFLADENTNGVTLKQIQAKSLKEVEFEQFIQELS